MTKFARRALRPLRPGRWMMLRLSLRVLQACALVQTVRGSARRMVLLLVARSRTPLWPLQCIAL
jgi:hypothetical protein